MFRLMSGIFANSLHGKDICFKRLSACKSRSARKSLSRDYERKPLAVELRKSSPEKEKSRLIELMKRGCPGPKDTVKERWFFTNQHIILTLAKFLDRPPNAVSNFLYLLTLQNFSKIMNPAVAPGKHCKVPMVNLNACEDYMRLFDTHGNIRSRFSHDSLILLMRVMQAWLKREAPKPFGSCFAGAHCKLPKGKKARRAGIDRNSNAQRNGWRRRQESDERACLAWSNIVGLPAKGCPSNPSGMEWNDSYAGKLTRGDPGYVFGMHFLPKALSDWDEDDSSGLRTLNDYEDELAAERTRRLEALLFQLNERTYLARDGHSLIEAIKSFRVGKSRGRLVKNSAIGNSAARTISEDYYQMLSESAIQSRQQKNLFQDNGKDSSQVRHTKHHSHKHKHQKPANQLLVEDKSAPTKKFYYAAQIPILAHEPFNQDKPWTWQNRHPQQVRMNDRGSIVADKTIRRYRRATIAGQMDRAREQASVHSIINNASETDMFGRRMDQKPATRKSQVRQSVTRKSQTLHSAKSDQRSITFRNRNSYNV